MTIGVKVNITSIEQQPLTMTTKTTKQQLVKSCASHTYKHIYIYVKVQDCISCSVRLDSTPHWRCNDTRCGGCAARAIFAIFAQSNILKTKRGGYTNGTLPKCRPSSAQILPAAAAARSGSQKIAKDRDLAICRLLNLFSFSIHIFWLISFYLLFRCCSEFYYWLHWQFRQLQQLLQHKFISTFYMRSFGLGAL